MPRVKFLKDTVHPDYGEIKRGEVLRVPHQYAEDYEDVGLAREVEDDTPLSRPEPRNASHKALDEERRAARTARVARQRALVDVLNQNPDASGESIERQVRAVLAAAQPAAGGSTDSRGESPREGGG